VVTMRQANRVSPPPAIGRRAIAVPPVSYGTCAETRKRPLPRTVSRRRRRPQST
jgi:hypothetical protein